MPAGRIFWLPIPDEESEEAGLLAKRCAAYLRAPRCGAELLGALRRGATVVVNCSWAGRPCHSLVPRAGAWQGAGGAGRLQTPCV